MSSRTILNRTIGFTRHNAAALAALLFVSCGLVACQVKNQSVSVGKRNDPEISQCAEADGYSTYQASLSKRSEKNVQQVIYSQSAEFFRFYQQALKDNSSMQGRVVFCLEIQPNGQVRSAEILLSELGDAVLEENLRTRLQQLDFGALDVGVWKNTYRMDFYPQ